MKLKGIKELMVPRDKYAVVSEDATLLDALYAKEEAQKGIPPGRERVRAVL